MTTFLVIKSVFSAFIRVQYRKCQVARKFTCLGHIPGNVLGKKRCESLRPFLSSPLFLLSSVLVPSVLFLSALSFLLFKGDSPALVQKTVRRHPPGQAGDEGAGVVFSRLVMRVRGRKRLFCVRVIPGLGWRREGGPGALEALGIPPAAALGVNWPLLAAGKGGDEPGGLGFVQHDQAGPRQEACRCRSRHASTWQCRSQASALAIQSLAGADQVALGVQIASQQQELHEAPFLGVREAEELGLEKQLDVQLDPGQIGQVHAVHAWDCIEAESVFNAPRG